MFDRIGAAHADSSPSTPAPAEEPDAFYPFGDQDDTNMIPAREETPAGDDPFQSAFQGDDTGDETEPPALTSEESANLDRESFWDTF